MSDFANSRHILAGELENALTAAFTSAVGALDSLRKTLRRHVLSRQDRGATLSEIDRELHLLIERIEEKAKLSGKDVPDGELTAQIMAWNKAFFAGGG